MTSTIHVRPDVRFAGVTLLGWMSVLLTCETQHVIAEQPIERPVPGIDSIERWEHSSFQLLGIARAQERATLRFSKQGNVQQVFVREGDDVTVGTKLVGLDDRIAQAALRMAQIEAENTATVRMSTIERDRVAKALERAEAGVAQQAVGQFELDAKRGDYLRAVAALELELEKKELAQAKLVMAKQEADSMALFAPFDGTVIELHAHVGESLGPTENAVTIGNLRTLEIELHLPLAMFGDIKVGKFYRVRAGQPVNAELNVVAQFVSPEVESTGNSFRAVFTYQNAETQYPSGFEVHFLGAAAGAHKGATTVTTRRGTRVEAGA